ncbi:MAG: TetR/AcrR family transcriptional regulator [Gammaproteobacteria bacterium]|nr:TetR/AcrR family transcriptional regulator [Gammaproteobacteria bacterium]
MPKIVDHEEYRKELLEKCFNLFCQNGYQKVSMRAIAKEIGVSTGTLYHYFSSKEKILEEMVPWAIETNIGAFIRGARDDLSLQERLQTLADFWVDSGDFYQNLILLVIDMVRSGALPSEEVFLHFSHAYSLGIAQTLDVSISFSKVVFVHLLGIVFHSTVTPQQFNYKAEIAILQKILGELLKAGEVSESSFIEKMLQNGQKKD